MRAKYFLYTLLIVIFSGCLERYWPEVDQYEALLVVDGIISDEPGPYQVRLSQSSSLDELIYVPFTNALLTIGDDLGNMEHLTEKGRGLYETDPDFQAVIGRQYKLIVQTPKGDVYETAYQELNAAPEIDSVYANVEMRDTRDPNHVLGGYQFYIDVKNNHSEGGYYYYRMEEAYEFRSALFIDYIYDGEFREMFNKDTLYTCYAQRQRGEIYTYDTKNLVEKDINGLPLVYISNESPRLNIRYSLLVKQYNINEEAFTYWNGIEKQRGDQGALYSKQPYQIAGNLKNINNPDEPVLGFFVVGGVKEKRIFVGKPRGVPAYIFRCTPDVEAVAYLPELSEQDYPAYLSYTKDRQLGTASDACFDCTLRGGKLEKPDFWDR